MMERQTRHRLTEEHAALDKKIQKLEDFVGEHEDGTVFVTLDVDEQKRLIRQLGHMRSYLQVLSERLAASA